MMMHKNNSTKTWDENHHPMISSHTKFQVENHSPYATPGVPIIHLRISKFFQYAIQNDPSHYLYFLKINEFCKHVIKKNTIISMLTFIIVFYQTHDANDDDNPLLHINN